MLSSKKYTLGLIFGCLILVGWFLQKVFSGRMVLPQEIDLGFWAVRYYGIFMGLGVATAFWFLQIRARRIGFSEEAVGDLLPYLVVGGLLGARAYHVASDFDFYLKYPGQILQIWRGGLSIYGAVGGGLLAAVIFQHKNSRFTVSELLNFLAPALPLGQAIGRLGNLFNYELFGYPTTVPWKMYVPEAFRPAVFKEAAYFHPWFLYEILGNLVVFAVLLTLKKRAKTNLFIWYVLLYNLLRFGLEFLRIDSVFHFGVRQNALVSLGLVLIALVFIFKPQTFSNPDV
jgi:phosphatidylglycerol:prolipoprotein diacylglycerol transferase